MNLNPDHMQEYQYENYLMQIQILQNLIQKEGLNYFQLNFVFLFQV